jgi:hypothetical protein
MDDREILELRALAISGGLSQDSLASLIDSNLSVPALVKSEAAAMANAKKAGLGLAERNKLREALRRHKDNVLSAVEPQIVEVGDDAEAHHIIAAQHQMMELRQKLRAQMDEEAKGEEVVKNGSICAGYRWTQELGELTVSVELPPGTAKRDVVCKISSSTLECGLRGQPPIIDGTLHDKVRVDDCLWQLQDSHRLIITLQKLVVDVTKQKWWPCLIQGENMIDTSKCVRAGQAATSLPTAKRDAQRTSRPSRPRAHAAPPHSLPSAIHTCLPQMRGGQVDESDGRPRRAHSTAEDRDPRAAGGGKVRPGQGGEGVEGFLRKVPRDGRLGGYIQGRLRKVHGGSASRHAGKVARARQGRVGKAAGGGGLVNIIVLVNETLRYTASRTDAV